MLDETDAWFLIMMCSSHMALTSSIKIMSNCNLKGDRNQMSETWSRNSKTFYFMRSSNGWTTLSCFMPSHHRRSTTCWFGLHLVLPLFQKSIKKRSSYQKRLVADASAFTIVIDWLFAFSSRIMYSVARRPYHLGCKHAPSYSLDGERKRTYPWNISTEMSLTYHASSGNDDKAFEESIPELLFKYLAVLRIWIDLVWISTYTYICNVLKRCCKIYAELYFYCLTKEYISLLTISSTCPLKVLKVNKISQHHVLGLLLP